MKNNRHYLRFIEGTDGGAHTPESDTGAQADQPASNPDETQEVDYKAKYEAMKVRRDLVPSAKEAPLQKDVLMWRGVRTWPKEFGVDSLAEVEKLDPFLLTRFRSLTTDRKQATEQFTTYGKAGAVLKITVKKGTPGIWMPTNGDPRMTAQQEFLIPPGAIARVKSVESGAVPVILLEVSYE